MMKGRAESLQSIPRLMHKEINYSTLSSLSLNDYHLINQFRLLEGYINNTIYLLYILVMTITMKNPQSPQLIGERSVALLF